MIQPGIAKPSRILVVALDNLGDLVFASALTPPLHAAFPDATIDFFSKSYAAPIARLVPHVTSVIHADPFWGAATGVSRGAIGPMLTAIRALRRRHYDVAILTGAPWRTAAAIAAAGISTRIGLARHRNKLFLTQVLPVERKDTSVLHEQGRLLAPLGIAAPEPRYSLDADRLGDALRGVAAQLPAHFVALHPFAGSRDRCVPLGEWTQVAFALAARRVPVLWIGTTRDLGELRSMTHPRGVYSDELGDGSLTATASALSLASLFAGHDSGPLHIAGAFGVPVVGVFAPGEPQRTYPQGMGPSRMLARSSPREISAGDILREIDALQVLSAT